ncbi:hypothetical protein [Novosphingobium clariflavum]|uniref:Uncharacterized protein n=1 Tax=Novosphingobium clariflavum TaxID=2029884 RepID=A0ABV6SF78_9SPHN|nr:hypothetical protein [Novosphingobium clariflavum]
MAGRSHASKRKRQLALGVFFAGFVLPELQKRRIFRSEYGGRTLRDHLGLHRPANRHLRITADVLS